MKKISLIIALVAVALVYSQERVVNFDIPIVETNIISSITVKSLYVNVEARTVTMDYELGGKGLAVVLWDSSGYDSSGLTNMWPVISNRVLNLATNGLLPTR